MVLKLLRGRKTKMQQSEQRASSAHWKEIYLFLLLFHSHCLHFLGRNNAEVLATKEKAA